MTNGTMITIQKLLKEMGWTDDAIGSYFLQDFGVVIESSI
jgi:ribosome-associated protein YbcJ (S4-like RNA binding protein)